MPGKLFSAYTLFHMSKLDEFYGFLDECDIGRLDEKTKTEIDDIFAEGGQKFDLLKKEAGKKIDISEK